MVLEHKFCIQKWKILILCSNTYYKRPEVHADNGNLFTFSMSICTKWNSYAPNEIQLAPNETRVTNETQFAPNET